MTGSELDWPLLSPLSDDERTALLSVSRRRKFARNEVICHEGDPGNSLHLIEKGYVAMRVTTPLGDAATLAVNGSGGFFGELALLTNDATRNSTVVALDAVETRSISRDGLDELRQAHPDVERFLIAALADEVRRLSARLLEALYVPVEQRLYRRLLDLHRLFGDGEAIPVTQDDLASMAGTTRPTANKVIKAAEAAGFVQTSRGKIQVLDPAALERRSR